MNIASRRELIVCEQSEMVGQLREENLALRRQLVSPGGLKPDAGGVGAGDGHLRAKLKQAARCIAMLTRDKQQLIAMDSRERDSMQDRDIDAQHVYMVDTHASYTPVSPRPVSPRPDSPRPPPSSAPPPGVRAYQTLVLVLLGLMFCGVTLQAVFFYRLSTSTSKPAAHLTDGHNIHGNEMLSWSTEGDSFVHQMKYRDGLLCVTTEGFYYVYSKVFFHQRRVFHHFVSLRTPTYTRPIALLMSRVYSEATQAKSNSYLGGVFHLHKGESLSVVVNNGSQLIQAWASENFFGAYMI